MQAVIILTCKFLLLFLLTFSFQASAWINKVIIDQEDRVVANVKKFPFSAIGKVRIAKNGKKFVCTGFLVAPKIVLTNAHCLMSEENSVGPTKVSFYPGYKRGSRVPNGKFLVNKVIISDKYISKVKGVDFAFLVLSRSAGNTFGWFGLTPFSRISTSLKNDLYVSGYGSNFIETPFKTHFQTVNQTPCKVIKKLRNNKALLHTCDTGQGNSGAPLFYLKNNKAYAVGINYGGIGPRNDERMESCEINNKDTCGNFATRSEEMIHQLNELRKIYN
jgi:V8-like Glu-specific endopeptidase